MELENWRSTCYSPLKRMSYALEHGLFSDVSFSVGSKGEVIRGHKAILSIGSPVFQALLSEKSSDENPIPIRDVQPSGFKHLLKYLYTEETPLLSIEDDIEFLRAVKYFKVEDLIGFCKDNIQRKLAVGNAIDVYENCKVLDEKELEEDVDGFIKTNAELILAEPKFYELSVEDLLHFISSDDFSAPEVPICRAVRKWGESECERQHLEKCPENLRLVLKTIIPQIRFPLMNSGDFAFEIAKLNVLTLEETVSIKNYFFARHHQRHQIPEDCSFISKPRKHVKYEDLDGVDYIVQSLIGGIDTGLEIDTIYTISNKGASSPNYLNVYYNFNGVVATKNLTRYKVGEGNLSTFWFIRRGSEPNTYTLFSKYRNGHLTWQNGNWTLLNSCRRKDKNPPDAGNLTLEPSKKNPGYFLLISRMRNQYSDKPLVLAFTGETNGDGFYAKFMEKPEEEIDSILWSFQKIRLVILCMHLL